MTLHQCRVAVTGSAVNDRQAQNYITSSCASQPFCESAKSAAGRAEDGVKLSGESS
jgi:hypothetical protein